MSPSTDPIFELESRAKELYNQKSYPECRALLEEALTYAMSHLRRVQVKKNVLATYDHERDRSNALRIAEETLQYIDENAVGSGSNEGAVLRGWFRGAVARYKGKPINSFVGFGPSLGAYATGAAVGAAVALTYGIEPVRSSVVGAIIGFLLLTRVLAPVPRIGLLVGSVNVVLTLLAFQAYSPHDTFRALLWLVGFAAVFNLWAWFTFTRVVGSERSEL